MKKIIYMLIGVAIGLWSSLSIGTIFIILLGVIAGFSICNKASNNQERKFIGWVYAIAFFLSILFSCINFYAASITKSDSDLIGDASAYSAHGAYIAEVLTNKKCNIETNYIDKEELNECRNTYKGKLPNYYDYRMGFSTYLNGIFYTLFGYSPLMIKFLNSILGIIGCFLIYFFIRNTFGTKEAKVVLILVLFLPSRFIWVTSGLKEAMVFFAFSLALFTFLKLQKIFGVFWTSIILFAAFIKYNFIYISLLVFMTLLLIKRKKIIILLANFFFVKLAFVLVYGLRTDFLIPLAIILGIASVAFLGRSKIIILIISLAILSSFLFFRINKSFLREQYLTLTSNIITDQRNRAQPYARSKYYIYPERFYNRNIRVDRIPIISPNELLFSYLLGMGYFFFSPFPWALSSKPQIIGYIQMPLLYLLMPFALIGIVIGFRYHWRETLLYFLFIFFIASITALFSGNVGTLFRHRDMIMPFFMAFAGIGLTRILKYSNMVYER